MTCSRLQEITEDVVRPDKTGADLLHDPALNKGTAFSMEERRNLGLLGLLPPRIFSPEDQVLRTLTNVRKKGTDLEKYIAMIALLDRNETLFYRIVIDNIEEMMPIIYTPVVGQACKQYASIFRRSRGAYISRNDKGHIRQILRNWPNKDVRVIVVTDGERILGLGDLGVSGMGIPVGKLSLYTACAGIHPSQTLPITLDVGTNNEAFLKDPLYLGTQERRLKGAEYDALVDEFVSAVQDVFPKALIQFEDFANHNAFRLLEKYRNEVCTFNDDIQGTASVVLAGLFSSTRLTKTRLSDMKLLFCGAGEAAIGIGDLTVTAMMAEGLSQAEARKRCWFMDSKALVESSRQDLQEHKKPYAHQYKPVADLLTAVKELKPTAIIGVSGVPNQFTQEIVEEMARINKQPIVMALSNPTANAECTAKDAYTWSGGRAIFASGSPFDPVTLNGKRYVPGQGNNAYIFPGVGLGVVECGARRVTDEMFSEAAKALAEMVTDADLESGCLYPPLTKIRDASVRIAVKVAEVAYARGFASESRPKDLTAHMRAAQYQPVYKKYI